METESSNMVNEDTTENVKDLDSLADFPIMQLFKRLIGNENKQNTVLTNSQIMEILEKEFHINTEELHELEMEIYLSVMKKFLKDWPQWDDFDTAINELKQKSDVNGMNKMLLKKYNHLKSYLSVLLDVAIPKAKEKVAEVEEKLKKTQDEQLKSSPEEDLSDLILEVQCSRPQLNNLIFKHPHPEQNHTIFNATESGPSKICLDTPDHCAILNWSNVNIHFKMTTIHFVRSNVHDIKHTLVNKKLLKKDKISKLKSGYQEKSSIPLRQAEMRGFKKEHFVHLLRKIYYNTQDANYKSILEVLFTIIEKDLAGLPNDMQEMMSYRKYFCRHPYVRYLCTEVPGAENDDTAMKYDLHLKEVISPMYQLDMIKEEPILNLNLKLADFQGIHLECKSCSIKFLGLSMLEQLKQHILENHLNEPDWQCTKCNQTITMVYLAKNRWSHECKK